ncbi:MAG TPA: glucose-1-phosphate thymidylyltransferase [Symbiobacteriaceae bacterium]|nr:glucose-1-phosphate thymidylyltransferase [Symbiobacteriaceae bacterium]
MKALVLCAGRGTRLRPLTHTRAKAALPVAGRPVLAHILSYLWRYGFADVGVVISPDQDELRSLPGAVPGQRVEFIVQRTPLGIAHAVRTAKDYLGKEPFLLYLGDNLTDEDLQPALLQFAAAGADAVIAVRTVANPRAFGIAELDGDRVAAVAEKPEAPRSDLAIAGIYIFRATVHEAIKRLTPSARGEFEITDAIAALIRRGRKVLAHRMSGWWQDMGSPEGMLAANALVLDTISTDVAAGVSLQTAQIQGRVVVGPGVTLQNVRLRGPLLIGPGSHLEDAYIGPYTSVGEGAWIRGAGIENSILLPGCRLDAPTFHLEDCLLGRGAVVEVKTGRAVTLLLGDDGRLQIPHGRRS